jgi:CheY-like chemotaxis protein
MGTLLHELGCEVHQADSSEVLACLCEQIRPDLVLADYRLRGSDNGVDAINVVWRKWPGTPAALISGDTAKTSLIAATELGVLLHHKPVNFEVLQRELERAIQTKNSQGVNR